MGGFANGLKSFGQNLATWAQGGGLTENSRQRQNLEQTKQNKDIQAQQAQREQQQAEMDLHEHLLSLGARPVVNGMAKDEQTLPEYMNGLGLPASFGAPSSVDPGAAPTQPGGPTIPQTLSIVRPADKSRTVSFKDSTGQQASYELPTPEEQVSRQVKLRQPANEQAVQQAGAVARATAAGTETGREGALADERQGAHGVTVPQGAGPLSGMRVLPGELPGAIQGSVAADTAGATIQQRQLAQASQDLGSQTNRLGYGAAYKRYSPDIQAHFDDPVGFDPRLSPLHARLVGMSGADQIKYGAAGMMAPEEWDQEADLAYPVAGSTPSEKAAAATQNRSAKSSIQRLIRGGKVEDAWKIIDQGREQQGKAITGVATARAEIPAKLAVAQQTQNFQNQQAQGLPGQAGATPTGPPGATPQPAAQTGEDYLNTLPTGYANKVRATIMGQISPPTGRAATSGPGAQLMNAVMKVDPQFSENRAQLRKAFTTGPDGRNLGALNTAAVHLDQLYEASKALGNGSFVPGNDIFNKFKTMFGGAAPTNFSGLQAAVSSEMATALKGNATDPEIAAMKQNVSQASSPEELAGIVHTNLGILAAKLKTAQERYQAAIPGDTAWSPVLPTARAVFQKFDAEGAGQAPVKVTDPKGTVHTFPNQAAADTFKKVAGIP